ncbi:MAG: putative helicase [Candidatus Endobugula sp.]
MYGILHSRDYRTAFANDLKKMLPRVPLVEDVRDFWKFSKAGRQLAELHINYEEVTPHEGVEVSEESSGNFKVQKMRFPKKNQKDTIIYNSKILVSNIPEKAYDYIVNGKSAIEWIMERYQVKTDKKSGIKNDPNDWAEEVGDPRYILDLLLSVINVSVQTVDIVEGLPRLDFEEDSESNQEIAEHTMVIATSAIGEVPVGSIGSVVHVYDKGKAYEVEFIVSGSNFVETAMGDQIKLK